MFSKFVSPLVVCEQAFRNLSMAAPNSSLFPNMRDLTWNPRIKDNTFIYIRLFLGPNTTSISYKLHPDNPEALSFLPVLPDLFPSLAIAQFLNDSRFNTKVCEILSSAVICWTHLHVLHVGNLNYAALVHISKLPFLRELCFTCLTKIKQLATPLNPACRFPALLHLEITTETIHAPIQLFEFVSASPLECIFINVLRDRSPLSFWSTLMNLINERCQKLTLQFLTIKNKDSDNSHRNPIDSVINLDALFMFPKLVELILAPTGGFLLSQETVSRMPVAWPRLERLELGVHKRSPGLSIITLPDLIPFAKLCPDLNHLGILLDARKVIEYTSKPGNGFQNRNLETLRVGDSPVGNPLSVAAFLSDIYPNLTTIYAAEDDDPSSGFSAGWREVSRATETMAVIRDQERSHYMALNTSLGDDSEMQLDSLIEE